MNLLIYYSFGGGGGVCLFYFYKLTSIMVPLVMTPSCVNSGL